MPSIGRPIRPCLRPFTSSSALPAACNLGKIPVMSPGSVPFHILRPLQSFRQSAAAGRPIRPIRRPVYVQLAAACCMQPGQDTGHEPRRCAFHILRPLRPFRDSAAAGRPFPRPENLSPAICPCSSAPGGSFRKRISHPHSKLCPK